LRGKSYLFDPNLTLTGIAIKQGGIFDFSIDLESSKNFKTPVFPVKTPRNFHSCFDSP
jgi:hypothetical protein